MIGWIKGMFSKQAPVDPPPVFRGWYDPATNTLHYMGFRIRRTDPSPVPLKVPEGGG